MKYVVIGNSTAAIGCVEGIRQLDRESPITLIASEPHHTYSRPLISYLLAGKTDEERMKYRSDVFYREHGVETLLGRTVLAISSGKKILRLDDGSAVPYDKLLAATGSLPFIPPIEGIDAVEEKTTFLTLDDAHRLENMLGSEKKVLILGAGLIGLKCAEGIAARVESVTVVDLAGHILPSILDKFEACIIQEHMEQNGVRFLLGQTVERFVEGHAVLSGGDRLPFDILIVAVGVRPNTALISEAGGRVNRGIVTDVHGRTSLPEVYAAGDCAESYDITTGEAKVLALLSNAYMQGESAGVHMAGGEKPYENAIPMNAIGFFGKHLITAGSYLGERYESVSKGGLKRLYCENNRLVGYMLLGDVARAGIYTALIRDQIPLDTLDFDMIKQRPGLMAFSRRERARKLGGVMV